MRPQANSLEFVVSAPLRYAKEMQSFVDCDFRNYGLTDLPSISEDHTCLSACATKELCFYVRKSAAVAQLFAKLSNLGRHLTFVCEW